MRQSHRKKKKKNYRTEILGNICSIVSVKEKEREREKVGSKKIGSQGVVFNFPADFMHMDTPKKLYIFFSITSWI